MLSSKAIEEFRNIHRQVFGQDISFVEADSHATALIRLYKAVLKPEFNPEPKPKEQS
jgi:hypothetical protein